MVACTADCPPGHFEDVRQVIALCCLETFLPASCLTAGQLARAGACVDTAERGPRAGGSEPPAGTLISAELQGPGPRPSRTPRGLSPALSTLVFSIQLGLSQRSHVGETPSLQTPAANESCRNHPSMYVQRCRGKRWDLALGDAVPGPQALVGARDGSGGARGRPAILWSTSSSLPELTDAHTRGRSPALPLHLGHNSSSRDLGSRRLPGQAVRPGCR